MKVNGPHFYVKTLFQLEDFESSKFLSLIGEDTIISKIGPPYWSRTMTQNLLSEKGFKMLHLDVCCSR